MPFINDKRAFPYLKEEVTVRYYTSSGTLHAPVAGTQGIKAAVAVTVSKPQRMREVIFSLERGGKVPELPTELTPQEDEDVVDQDISLTTPTRDANGSGTFKAEGKVTFRLKADRAYVLAFPKSQSYDPGQEPQPLS